MADIVVFVADISIRFFHVCVCKFTFDKCSIMCYDELSTNKEEQKHEVRQ